MSLSMYQASVPVFTQILGALGDVLDKAEAHAAARKIDPAVCIAARLAPDMFPLGRQVQIACDFAKGATARLAGVEVPELGRRREDLRGVQGADQEDGRLRAGLQAGADRRLGGARGRR